MAPTDEQSPPRAAPRPGHPPSGPAASPARPGASPPGPGGPAAFVGRLEELAQLRGAVDALTVGLGSLFLLTGEAGIGKTRLSEELGALASASGVTVVWGRCHEAEGRPPYWPWAQIVQSCARHFEPATLAAFLVPDALALAELIPSLRPHLKYVGPPSLSIEPDAARFRLFQALTALLRGVAADRPLLLVLDDLHWADLPSLRMLEFLAHELPDVPILVVATYREIEVRNAGAATDIFDRLGRRGRQLSLAGFSVEEVSRFVESSAGQRVPEALAQRLRRETEGNPFFLDEIVRQFRGAGWWLSPSTELPVSQGVRSAIRRRLAPLPPASLRLMSAAAVAGREFDLPLLESALRCARVTLLEQLAPAIELEILAPIADKAGCYRFSHALIRETIYEQLPAAERIELHRGFAGILETRHASSLDGVLPEIAHHFFAAAAGGGEAKAIAYAQRAGHQALRVLAYEEAADQFQRALHLSEISPADDAERNCELLLALAEARNRAGQNQESSEACHRAAALARRIGSSALLARAAIGLCDIGVAWAELGRSDDTLVHTLEEALAQLGADQPLLRARAMARLATELFWTRPLSRIDTLSAEAVELARRHGDGPTLAYALLARIHCVSDPDSFETRRRLIDEILQLTGGRGELAINAYLWRFGDELQFGQPSSAEASGERLIRAVEDLRQPRDLWLIPAVRSRQAVLLGRFDEAERLAEQVVEHGRGVHNAEQAYLALLFMIRREQGRHTEMLGGMVAVAAQSVVTVWRVSLTLLYAESGHVDEALAEMERLTRDGLAEIRRDLIWLFSVASLSAACSACASPVHAQRLYDALLPYQGTTVAEGVFCYFGPASYYLGLLATTRGDVEAATRHLDEALTAARRLGARPFIARILLAQAEAAEAARGPASSASSAASSSIALRQQAAELASSMGMDGVAAAARRGLENGGEATESEESRRAELKRDGEDWIIQYKGRVARMKALRGFLYLARLLESPHREFHVLEIAQGGVAPDAASPLPAGEGLGPVLDARAKAEIRARLEDLRAEVAEAERHNDHYRAEKSRAEIEAIGAQIAGAVGLGGRDRVNASHAERARAAVTKALRAAIDRIERVNPPLAELLSRTVRTGTYCSYVPLAEAAVRWEVRLEEDQAEPAPTPRA